MSLTLALNNAITGINASQQSLAVISQNIANANNEDYSRQRANQSAITVGNSIGAGVKIEEVTRVVDDRIQRTVVTKNSDYEAKSIIADYYSQTQIYFGQPGANNSLDSYVSAFFNSVSNLSSTIAADRGSYRQDVIIKANNLATTISSLASNIQDLRFQADKELKAAVDEVNTQLKNIAELNRSVRNARSLGQSVTAFEDEIDKALKTLSSNIDIQYRKNDDGTININTAGGAPLFEDGVRYELDYTASVSVDDLINNTGFDEIGVYRIRENGTRDPDIVSVLATGGISDNATTIAQGGKIKGLLDTRDGTLNDMLKQLDNMAAQLRDAINAVHNDGVGYPPPTSLTGTTLINPTETKTWSGKAMIAIVKEDGTPVQSPYGSASLIGFEPLILDLSTLNDGAGAGKPSFQSIIDAINEHFGVPNNRTIITSGTDTLMNDVSLVSQSDSLTAGTGIFNFGVNFSNLTDANTDVRIIGATVTPTAGTATITTPAAFPTSYYTTTAGTETTGFNFAVDMSSATSGPYTISLNVEVKNRNGGTDTTTITYQVADTASAFRNDKISVSSVAGSAQIEVPNTTNSFMKATLVDENGKEVAYNGATNDYTKSGYLKIETSDGSYRLAISELDSKEASSGKGLSYYFGLNNFFVDDNKGKQGAAIKLKIRNDIQTDPSRISTAKLFKSADNSATAKYTYQISNAGTDAAKALADLGLNAQSFDFAGSLPNVKLTFSDYAAEILSYAASASSNAKSASEQAQLVYNGFNDKNQSIKGVNIDEELANTITFQNAYAANARIISVTKDLFDTLIGSFN